MRRALAVALGVALLGAGAFSAWRVREGSTGDRVREFRGTVPLLAARFQYPADWRLKEHRGEREPYAEALVVGPKNAAETFRAAFSVRGVPAGVRYRSLEAYRDEYLSHFYRDPRIERMTKSTLGGRPAWDVTVSYTLPALHRPGLKGEPVPLRSRLLFAEHAGVFYLVTYIVDDREHQAHAPAFARLIDSFRF